MSNTSCFHCNLPIREPKPPTLHILDKQREFCCAGCKAVADAIVSSGNEGYYRHRTKAAKSAVDHSQPTELLGRLKLYDNDRLQQQFVRTSNKGKNKEAWLILEDIRCAACMWLNERTLRQLDGILDVQMDYTGHQARVRWQADKISFSDILTAIHNIGYHAHPFDPSQREALNQEQKQRSLQRILFALILGMMVMQSAIAGYFFDTDAQGDLPIWLKISRWANLFSTFLILAYPGQLFYRNAWRDLKNKTLGMDVPVVTGLSAAWLVSAYHTFTGQGDVYFESIAMFVIFLLIARHIELRGRITATLLLDRANKIIPGTANLIDAGNIREVPVFELRQGQTIHISPGEVVPVDGLLLSQSSNFDESLLTGESLPAIHQQGDTIMGGSINIDQPIKLKVTSKLQDSAFGNIQQLTRYGLNFQPHYIDLAEKAAVKFISAILLIALLTYIGWTLQESPHALIYAISVLIVTCPCALALAAPVALSLGSAGLSEYHLLSTRISSIEKFSHINMLAFDKTGTLTKGKPQLESITLVGTLNKDTCLDIAAHMEQGSFHPFARAIIDSSNHSKTNSGKFSDIKTTHIPGKGVEAVINNVTWKLGNHELIETHLHDLSAAVKQRIQQWQHSGKSILYFANEAGIQAIFCFSDQLRDGVHEFIADCRQAGIKHFALLSGDHTNSVQSLAQQLGITLAYGNLTPEKKLNWLKQQQNDHNIMMFGDGINDAPTLAAANLSLSFAEATDLAKTHSDFIAINQNFTQFSKAFSLMRKTRRIVLQNLGWAIAYNVISIPAAVMGLVTPWIAAIGMSLSSLLVVMNSLRLKKSLHNTDFDHSPAQPVKARTNTD